MTMAKIDEKETRGFLFRVVKKAWAPLPQIWRESQYVVIVMKKMSARQFDPDWESCCPDNTSFSKKIINK